MGAAASKVAIVIPNHREEPLWFEQVSLKRLLTFYGQTPLVMVSPPELKTDWFEMNAPGIKVIRFPFSNVREYSQLLLNPDFYDAFQDFEYILIHQLDCYVFGDELAYWCAKGYDYIGAPLFEGFEPERPRDRPRWVGNGGFSLRKVSSALKVLRSNVCYMTARECWTRECGNGSLAGKLLRMLEYVKMSCSLRNNVRWCTAINFHEDVFWAQDARRFLCEFSIPSVAEALEFAFDYAPEYCFALNNKKLPFACHGWPRNNLAFWARYIPMSNGSMCSG